MVFTALNVCVFCTIEVNSQVGTYRWQKKEDLKFRIWKISVRARAKIMEKVREFDFMASVE